jgi:hypothetical protein
VPALDTYLTSYWTISGSTSNAVCNEVSLSVYSDSGLTTTQLQTTFLTQSGGSTTENLDTATAIDVVATGS